MAAGNGMPTTMYPHSNQNYSPSLSGCTFNGSVVQIPPGGILSGAGLLSQNNQIILQLYVTVNGGIEVYQGDPSWGGISVGQWTLCTLGVCSAAPGQEISGFGFTEYNNQITLAPYCDGNFVFNNTGLGFSNTLKDLYVNTNTVVVPNNSVVTGIGMNGSSSWAADNQIGIEILS